MAVVKPESHTTRVYRWARRAEQARRTRARILAAATQQFVARGYAPTTMGSVAEAARVSVPTIELIFGTKPKLLKAAIDFAIAGDDKPVPMFEREWAAAAAAAEDATSYLAIFAWLLREPVVFQRLTGDRSWTPAQFERWFTESASRLLLPHADEVGATTGGRR